VTGAAPATPLPARSGPSWLVLSLLALLGLWTARLVAVPGRGCFLDLINLAFHEAGHLFLTPFGSTLHVLGGTLGQLAVPLLLAVYFLLAAPASPLGAAVCAWWFGENLVNISVYMADARDLALPLVGGGEHDWNELFYRFGLLGENSVRVVSSGTRGAGIVLMLLGLGWVAFFALPRRTRDTLIAAVEAQAPALLFLLRDSRT
jgi:hypothetical protein